MAVRATTPSPRRILATGFGAFLALYVLTAAWVVVEYDTQSAAGEPSDPPDSAAPVVASAADGAPDVTLEVVVDVADRTVTITGVVASVEEARAVARLVHDRTAATVVVNRLDVDPAASGRPDVGALLDRVDGLLGGR